MRVEQRCGELWPDARSTGRTTFVVDGAGKVVDVYDSVINYFQHTKFVAKVLERLATETSPS